MLKLLQSQVPFSHKYEGFPRRRSALIYVSRGCISPDFLFLYLITNEAKLSVFGRKKETPLKCFNSLYHYMSLLLFSLTAYTQLDELINCAEREFLCEVVVRVVCFSLGSARFTVCVPGHSCNSCQIQAALRGRRDELHKQEHNICN